MSRPKPLWREWDLDRKTKRKFRKHGINNPLEIAFTEGEAGVIRNYPPGLRRDNYLAGKHIAEKE